MLHFPREEFDNRIAQTRNALVKHELDGLLIFAQESHYYLTGFDTGGYKFFQCSVLTTDDTQFTLLTRRPDLNQARLTSIYNDIRIWYDGEGVNPAATLKEILTEKCLQGKRVGIELATYGLTAANWELIRTTLDGFCTLVDASSIVQRQRTVKSELELNYIKRAAELADDAIGAVRKTARSGISEGRVEAAVNDVVLTGGGDNTIAKVVFASGPNVFMGRATTGQRTLEAGDQMTVEWAGIYRRYHAGIYRTFAIGKAKPEHKELFVVTNAALQAMTEAAKPGEPIGRIDQAHRDVMDRAGYADRRQPTGGYSVGATFPPKGLPDYPPLLYPENPMIAEPGMTFFFHPLISDREAGSVMKLGHTIVITRSGCEVLSKLTPEYYECL